MAGNKQQCTSHCTQTAFSTYSNIRPDTHRRKEKIDNDSHRYRSKRPVPTSRGRGASRTKQTPVTRQTETSIPNTSAVTETTTARCSHTANLKLENKLTVNSKQTDMADKKRTAVYEIFISERARTRAPAFLI